MEAEVIKVESEKVEPKEEPKLEVTPELKEESPIKSEEEIDPSPEKEENPEEDASKPTDADIKDTATKLTSYLMDQAENPLVRQESPSPIK